MKKYIKTILLSAVILLFAATGFSQPPPPPGGGHGQTGNQTGGNAPIGGGLFILLGLGAAYGGKKIHTLNKEKSNE